MSVSTVRHRRSQHALPLFRLATILLCVVLFAIPAVAQPRLSDEDCYRIAIQEGAAAVRGISVRESAEDRQVAALRRAMNLPGGIPPECRDRPTPEKYRFKPLPPISEQEGERRVRQSNENAGTPNAKCTKKQYGSGWVTVCE